MTKKWYKASWVCSNCDSLTEQTSYEHTFADWSPTCNCIESNKFQVMLSVEDATIDRSTKLGTLTEGNEIETTYGATVSDALPESYNPNALTTYKSINDGVVTYPVIKTVDLEWEMNNITTLRSSVSERQYKIDAIIENLTTDGWYNPNTEKEEILSELCEILGHSPTQLIRMTATVQVSVDHQVPMGEAEDFDAQMWLQDNLTVDIYGWDSSVESFDVQGVDVDWE